MNVIKHWRTFLVTPLALILGYIVLGLNDEGIIYYALLVVAALGFIVFCREAWEMRFTYPYRFTEWRRLVALKGSNTIFAWSLPFVVGIGMFLEFLEKNPEPKVSPEEPVTE